MEKNMVMELKKLKRITADMMESGEGD